MRWYHWIFILCSQVFITLVVIALLLSQVKVVSFMEISVVGVDEMAKALSAGEDPQKLMLAHTQKLKKVEERIRQQKGIVLLKECVVKGPFEDITKEVLR